jgi:hypothetical protein
MVEILDWAEILTADLMLEEVTGLEIGESGTTAYLQTLVVTIEEDASSESTALIENNTPPTPKGTYMEFKQFVRKPFTIEAVEITN